MSVTLNCFMLKRCNSRSLTYSCKTIMAVLSKLGWQFEVPPSTTLSLDFSKSFPTREAAIAGRKELDFHFRLINRKVPNVYFIKVV